ncbi:MAG: D-alanyl-D-alanine carboxypeptidase/D-alanyl-D-alanine-endopeptidase [Actinobacteria bacterium]|nr:D-alanyl-D-alanine carboxypeptidase/D-alanyl-D-alanine-endopeptidase [Actinomycetota bacterium]
MRSHLPLVIATTLVLALALTAAVVTGEPTMVEAEPALAAAGPLATEPPPTTAPEPASDPTPAQAPAEPEGRDALRRSLYGAINDPGLVPTGQISLVVLDEAGTTVVDRLGASAVMPASTQKLVTAAAALRGLGADHRFTTTARAAVPVSTGGAIAGDLVIQGGGDPTLATGVFCAEIYPVRPCTQLEQLADAIVAAGVVRITGALVADGRAYGGAPLAEGWTDGYLADFDARPVVGLTSDAALDVVVEPDGDLEVQLSPDPALATVERLAAMLGDRGVSIAGGVRVGDAGPTPAVIAELHSQPVSELLAHTVQRSDNHLADHLFHELGRRLVGAGSWAAGDLATRLALGDLDVDWTGAVLADGSGLSRSDRLSARMLASLDRQMGAGEHRTLWRSLMAVTGDTGTLRGRLQGTPAQSRFAGKTGTLADVVSLVGTAHGHDGRTYHLAVLVNGPGGAAWRNQARLFFDEVVLLLTEDLYGCKRTVHELVPDAAPDAAPPLSWVCAAA